MTALVFLLMLILPQDSLAQEVWSLERCIEHAHSNNLQLQLNDLNIENTKIAENQAKANRLPSLNGNAGYSINFAGAIDPTTYEFRNQQIQNNNFGLTTQVPLYQGGRLKKMIEKSQLDLQKVLIDKETAKNDISLTIASSYLSVLLTKEQLTITGNQKALSEEQKSNTKKLIDAGLLPEGDILDLESQIANNELNITTAQNAYDLALLNLKLLLDLDPNIEIELETPPDIEPTADMVFAYKVDDVYEAALDNQPVIKSAKLDSEISLKNLELSKTGRYPSLSFVGNLSTNFSTARQEVESFTFEGISPIGFVGFDTSAVVNQPNFIPSFRKIKYGNQLNDNFLQYVGLNLQVPIFNQFQVKNGIEQAELGLKTAQLNSRIAKQNLNRSIRQAYLALNELQAKSNKYDYLFKLKILDFYLGNPIKF